MKGGLAWKLTLLFLIVTLPTSAAHIAALMFTDISMQSALREQNSDAMERIEQFVRGQPQAMAQLAGRLARDLEDKRLDCDEIMPALFERIPAAMAEVVRLSSPSPLQTASVGSTTASTEVRTIAGHVACSKHLPAGIGLPAPTFTAQPDMGMAVPIGPGNPPRSTPAWVGIAHFRDHSGALHSVWVGRPIGDDRLDGLVEMANGRWSLHHPAWSGELEPPEGARRSFDLRTLDAESARLVVTLSEGPWPKARARLLRLEMYLFASSLGLALLVALLFARAVSRPLLQLSRAAGRVAEGDLSTRVEIERLDELGRLAMDFNDMTEQLEITQAKLRRAERMAAWREAARRVAHEVKNPLFPIRVAMETVNKAVQRGHAELKVISRDATETVLGAVKSIDRLVGEFSEFARLPTPTLSPTSIVGLLQRVQTAYRATHPESEVVLGRIDDSIHSLDAEMMFRALSNLVKNALEALEAVGGGTVWLEARDTGRLTLSVEDNGPGVPEDIREHLFEPYVTRKERGTGLGLVVVERIVDAHGGRVELSSPSPRGTEGRPGTLFLLVL
ncbi:MAG: PAS domain-containing sensor histidine kinase [Myxococcota bacterium]